MPRPHYSYDLEYTIERDEPEGFCEDVLVLYNVPFAGSPGIGPSLNYPGEPPEAPEFDISPKAIMADGSELILTEPELQAIEELLHDTYEPDDYDPRDY